MAKSKTKRTRGRKPASPKRATRPAKSRRSKKTLKKRVRSVAKTPRRVARKAVKRRASARRTRSSVRAKANRQTVARQSAKKAVARRSAKRPAARKVAATSPVKKAAASAKKAARLVKRVVAVVVRKTPAALLPTPAPVARYAPPMPPPAPTPARAARKAARVHAKPPALERQRRHLPEADVVPSPPSSLDLNRTASAARSGQAEIAEHLADHTETGPELTAGDIDASWESAYSTGDEAPGGDNPTPDQDIVDDIGKSLGVVYEDTEELKGADKITERDKHRWELDPASAEDFKDR